MEIEKTLHFTMAVNGDKGWQSIGGTVSDLGPERLKELREEIYILGLETLLPLKKDGVELTPLPEIKVNGQPAVGVKAKQGHADAKLYFDAHSHLLVKIERNSDEAVSLAKEYLFGGHKELDGMVLQTRVVGTPGRQEGVGIDLRLAQIPVQAGRIGVRQAVNTEVSVVDGAVVDAA